MKRGSDAFPRGNEALSGAALLLNVAGGEGGPESGADAENAAAHAMVPAGAGEPAAPHCLMSALNRYICSKS